MNTETEATIAALRQEVHVLTARITALESGQTPLLDVEKLAKAIAVKIHQRDSRDLDAVGKSGPELINLP